MRDEKVLVKPTKKGGIAPSYGIIPKTPKGTTLFKILSEYGKDKSKNITSDQQKILICLATCCKPTLSEYNRVIKNQKLIELAGVGRMSLSYAFNNDNFLYLCSPNKIDPRPKIEIIYNIKNLLQIMIDYATAEQQGSEATYDYELDDYLEDISVGVIEKDNIKVDKPVLQSRKSSPTPYVTPTVVDPLKNVDISYTQEIKQEPKEVSRDFTDLNILTSVKWTIYCFNKISEWSMETNEVPAWYHRVNINDNFADPEYQLKDIRNSLWDSVIKLRDRLKEEPESSVFLYNHAHTFIRAISFYSSIETMKNPSLALGDRDLWGNILDVWEKLGKNADVLSKLCDYVDQLFNACKAAKIIIAHPKRIIHLGGLDKLDRKNSVSLISEWLLELYAYAFPIERNLNVYGKTFEDWVKTKIEKSKKLNNGDVFWPRTFSRGNNKQCEPTIEEVIGGGSLNGNGSNGKHTLTNKDPKVRKFLNLSSGCEIVAVFKGFSLNPEHVANGGTIADVVKISGDEYYDKSGKKWLSVYHYDNAPGGRWKIFVSDRNIDAFTKDWHDQSFRNVLPTEEVRELNGR